jgi:hypothetical protein
MPSRAGDAVASVQSLQRQQQLQAESLAKAERAYDFAVQRYQAGLGSQITVLNTETQLINQRRLAVDLQARELDTRVGWPQAWAAAGSDDTARVQLARNDPQMNLRATRAIFHRFFPGGAAVQTARGKTASPITKRQHHDRQQERSRRSARANPRAAARA